MLSVGLGCLYGLYLMLRPADTGRVETVWLLTAFARAAVAVYLGLQCLTGTIEAGWLGVAAFDAACVVVQAVGLRQGWLCHVRN